MRFRVTAGEHWVAVSALNLYDGLPAKYKGNKPNMGPEPPPQDFSQALKPKPNATPEELKELEERRVQIAKRRAPKPPMITDVSFRVNFVEITGPFNAKRNASRPRVARRSLPAQARTMSVPGKS